MAIPFRCCWWRCCFFYLYICMRWFRWAKMERNVECWHHTAQSSRASRRTDRGWSVCLQRTCWRWRWRRASPSPGTACTCCTTRHSRPSDSSRSRACTPRAWTGRRSWTSVCAWRRRTRSSRAWSSNSRAGFASTHSERLRGSAKGCHCCCCCCCYCYCWGSLSTYRRGSEAPSGDTETATAAIALVADVRRSLLATLQWWPYCLHWTCLAPALLLLLLLLL